MSNSRRPKGKSMGLRHEKRFVRLLPAGQWVFDESPCSKNNKSVCVLFKFCGRKEYNQQRNYDTNLIDGLGGYSGHEGSEVCRGGAGGHSLGKGAAFFYSTDNDSAVMRFKRGVRQLLRWVLPWWWV